MFTKKTVTKDFTATDIHFYYIENSCFKAPSLSKKKG